MQLMMNMLHELIVTCSCSPVGPMLLLL